MSRCRSPPSTYYAHRARPPSARSVTDAAPTTLIEQVHAKDFGVYGARRIHAQLHRQGHPVAHERWIRLDAGSLSSPRTETAGIEP